MAGVAEEQLELAPPALLDDLRARLSFARIGLTLSLSESELIARLMRSVSLSLTPQEQRETIILNAKNLLDVDADSRFLAGRILLTYIYEETLPWKISDGIDQLKEAHRKAFLKYIPLGIEIKRLDPRLAEFNLKALADAIDPYADLQFDFIGVQNLYDRYLIHMQDPTAPTGRRRLEVAADFLDARRHGPRHAGSRTARRARRNSTASTRTSAPAPPRPRSSIPARIGRSSRAATCSIAATRWRKSRRPGPAFPCSRSGRAASAARGRRCAAAAPTSTAPTASRRASSRS